MRSVTVTTSGTSTSNVVVFDCNVQAFNVGIGAKVSGTATYTIQHTFDDPFQSGGLASATWYDHDVSDMVGATANQNGNFAYPCRAARVNQTAGTGTVTATFIQGSF